MKKTLIILLSLICTFNLHAGDIAVVHMDKIFDGYYRTMVENEKIEVKIGAIKKTLKSMEADIQKLQDNYAKLMKDSTNTDAFTDKAREQKIADAKATERMGQEKIKELQGFSKSQRGEVAQLHAKIKEDIVKEIRAKIAKFAEENNLDAVFDASAVSATGVKNLIYSNPKKDITTELLSQLNAGKEERIKTMKKIEDERKVARDAARKKTNTPQP